MYEYSEIELVHLFLLNKSYKTLAPPPNTIVYDETGCTSLEWLATDYFIKHKKCCCFSTTVGYLKYMIIFTETALGLFEKIRGGRC